MNFKRKWLFFVLPLLVLSAALGWTKWKRENPTPTVQDLAIRKRFLTGKGVVLFLDNQPVEGPDGKDYHLSIQDEQQIAEHIWVTSSPSGVASRFTTRAIFTGSFGFIGLDFARSDYYSPDLDNYDIKLYPATSRYLRWWLEQHPTVEKQIALK